MQRNMLIAKLHRVTVTQADPNYVGSVTIDRTLLDAARLLPGERVDIVDVTNGTRLTTYVIEGEAGSGQICINGAAAHLIQPGDIAIIIAYAQMDEAEAWTSVPRVVFVDHDNRIVDIGGDPRSSPTGSVSRHPALLEVRTDPAHRRHHHVAHACSSVYQVCEEHKLDSSRDRA